MTEKLNKLSIFQSNGYKSDTNMYYLYSGSERSNCYKCTFQSSCPYSYMKVYHNEAGHCVKCFRFIPSGEYSYKDVSIYCSTKSNYEHICFRAGRIL